MNKKLFLFGVTLLIILLNVSCVKAPLSVKKADFDGLIKQKIYVEGIGGSIPKDAPLETRKQEAFVAAFLDGIRNIAEQIAKSERGKGKDNTIFSNLRKKVAGFEVDSQSIMKDFKLTDLIIVNFKGQRFIIKNFRLISPPVEFVEFPKWDNPPAAISGIQIQDLKWEEYEGEAGISYGAISIKSAVTHGLCGYKRTLKNAYSLKERLGESPLTVRAIGVKSRSKGDVVVSREDADRILEAVKNNDFFKECRVVMVVD